MKTRLFWKNTLNFILFQLCWFACVLGGAQNQPFLGPLAVLFSMILQLFLFFPQWQRELMLWLFVGILGTLADSLLMWFGIFRFPVSSPLPWSYPIWMTTLWVLFATTLHASMQWMSERYWLSSFFGLLGGPLSYYAGFRCQAILFHPNLEFALSCIGLFWALMMPLLLKISHLFSEEASLGHTENKN